MGVEQVANNGGGSGRLRPLPAAPFCRRARSRRDRAAQRGEQAVRGRRDARRQSQGGAVRECRRPSADRQCAREPHPLRQGVRHHAAKAAAGNPAAAAQQAGIRRGEPQRGAGAAGRHDRRRRRPDQVAGASAARQGRRALHLRRHGFRARSRDRHDQCRPAPLHGARPRHHRHRPRRAERPAQHLSGDAGARRTAADERRGRRPSGRLFRRDHADAGRRDGAARLAARRADAAGEERQQRPARAGRRRMGDRRLSRRGRLQGAGRPLRRIPRLLRRRQDQSGVPRHRHHAARGRAVPDAHHRRPDHEPHRHRAALYAAHRGR